MDKYQKYILNKYGDSLVCMFYRACPIEQEEQGSSIQYFFFNEDTNSITIKQDDDINKTKYVLTINTVASKYTLFSGVFVFKNNQWFEISCIDKQYRIVIDFNERIDTIKFVFINNLADDYTVKLTYIEADKGKYYARLEEEQKHNLLKAANIKVATGSDLVNIYFRPCCDKYDHTEILLCIPNKDSSWSPIKKCQIPTDDFYISINGLAYGKYAFILKQYDKKNNMIVQTDYITFKISPQEEPILGRLNII